MAARELSNDLIDVLIAQSINPSERGAGDGAAATVQSRLRISRDQSIQLANGMTLPFVRVPRKSPVFCPFHADDHASAFVVTNEDGVNGLHCATCKRSYWPDNGVRGIDFFLFDRIVKETPKYFAAHRDHVATRSVFNTSAAKIGLLACNITICEGEPAPPELQLGLTLVKSAKATGKTHALVELLARHRRVLVIGHRRSLLRQCSKRLGVAFILISPAGLPRS